MKHKFKNILGKIQAPKEERQQKLSHVDAKYIVSPPVIASAN